MGYIPQPPPQLRLIPDGTKPRVSPVDPSTFDEWVMLPVEDLRTLQEYADNPVRLVWRIPMRAPTPPTTGYLRQSTPTGNTGTR